MEHIEKMYNIMDALRGTKILKDFPEFTLNGATIKMNDKFDSFIEPLTGGIFKFTLPNMEERLRAAPQELIDHLPTAWFNYGDIGRLQELYNLIWTRAYILDVLEMKEEVSNTPISKINAYWEDRFHRLCREVEHVDAVSKCGSVQTWRFRKGDYVMHVNLIMDTYEPFKVTFGTQASTCTIASKRDDMDAAIDLFLNLKSS